MPDRESRVYKFVMRPGEENDVRKALGGFPATVGEGDDALAVTSFLRGSSVFLFTEGAGDPFERLRKDAGGRKLLDTLRKHADYDEADLAERQLTRFFPRRAEEPRAEVTAG